MLFLKVRYVALSKIFVSEVDQKIVIDTFSWFIELSSKENTILILFAGPYKVATFLASDSVLGILFPFEVACFFSYENISKLNFRVCIIT